MQPHRLNVVGPFYVVDRCCTACGVPEVERERLLRRNRIRVHQILEST